MPQISVIIPVFNSEKYVSKCLDSLINQSFKDIEIICVDDCSTDNSLEILNSYAQNDKRIKVLHNEKNINVGLSRNRGLEAASGKYIHFMDSDDWLDLDAYEVLMKQKDDIDVIYFYIRQISNLTNKPKDWSHLDNNYPLCICNFKSNPEIMDNWVRYVYNKLYLKSFLNDNNIRFNDFPCFEDHEFSLKVLLYANSILFVDKVFYNYRVDNSNSITGNFSQYKDFAVKSYIIAEHLSTSLDKELKNKVLSCEFSKMFGILDFTYILKKINYEEFRNILRQIDVSCYDKELLNTKKFVQYKEVLYGPEILYKLKTFLRDFTRKNCPLIHDFLMFIRQNLRFKLKKVVLIFFILLLCSISWYNMQDFARYKLSAPMQDVKYKKAIIKASKNKSYTLEKLRPIAGPEELTEFIKTNDDNPEIYNPSEENIKSGTYAANLHMHTIYSDGKMAVSQLLDKAQEYAKDFPEGKYMYIAITDHNTVLGAQNLIRVLQENPNKYTKIKIVPGIEVFTKYNNSKYSPRPVEIHVLTWCINPYDKFLNEEFFKFNLGDKYNYKNRDFDKVIKMMSKYGITGVAHPARYTTFLKANKYPYMKEMLELLKHNSQSGIVFTEGYYQTYPVLPEKKELGDEYETFLNYINETAEELSIIRTGSTDTHGYSIFRK